jgi:hypothetical protein
MTAYRISPGLFKKPAPKAFTRDEVDAIAAEIEAQLPPSQRNYNGVITKLADELQRRGAFGLMAGKEANAYAKRRGW